MKRLYQILFLLGAFVLAGGLWNCSDDDNPGEPAGPETNNGPVLGVEEPGEDALFATYVNFKLDTKGAESYGYKVEEGDVTANLPDAAGVYAEAQEKGNVEAVTGDSCVVTVEGLEGSKTYTVFFVFKLKEEFKENNDEYQLFPQVVTTSDYSQLVTIIKSDMFSVTFHVGVPADEYFSVGLMSMDMYKTYEQYGRTDVDYTQYSGGMANPRYKGPQNITIANGVYMYEGALNEEDYKDDAEETVYAVHPGTGYVLFVSQCAEDGSTDAYSEYTGGGGGGDWGGDLLAAKLPNVKEYTEEQPSNENVTFTGHYAKTVFFTQNPDQGQGNVGVTIDRITEKSALVTFTPTEDVLQYAIMMMPDAERDYYLPSIGGEEGLQAFVLNNGELFEGTQQMRFELEQGEEYSLYVVGVCSDDGSVQTFNSETGIQTIVSDKPVSELTVTPLESNNPYQVGFNVKAPNGDCFALKYILNYTKDWYPALNQLGGVTEDNIASMMSQYGTPFDSESLGKVNSAEGCDMYFTSIDDIESWLILEAANEDEKTKLFYDGDEYRATSAALPAEPPVSSELFEKLQGNWTATMTRISEEGNPVEETVTMPVTIAAGPEEVASMPEDVRNALINYYVENGQYTEEEAGEAVDNYFNEYKERTEYYTQKYKNMNCLVATGFSYDDFFSSYASPWDLFKSTEYSAYNTDEMFRDYGPKLFLKIDEGDKATVITTRYAENGYDYARYVDPVADWSMTLLLYGYDAGNNSPVLADFPVEISEDMNTITIKPVVSYGVTYYPGFAAEYSPGFSIWSFQVDGSGIVLTRDTETTQISTRRNISPIRPKVSARSGNHFRRTRTPFGFVAREPLQGKVFSMDDLKKGMQRDMK